MEKRFRVIGWDVSGMGQKVGLLIPGAEFFFREGEYYPVSPEIGLLEAQKKINQLQKQKPLSGRVNRVFDIEETDLV